MLTDRTALLLPLMILAVVNEWGLFVPVPDQPLAC